MADVLVVGGGIGGLSLARELSLRGLRRIRRAGRNVEKTLDELERLLAYPN